MGLYRRFFQLPEAFEGRHTRIRFEGVDSAFYVFINGFQAGFSKGSHMPAEFDLTQWLHEGRNELRVLTLSQWLYLCFRERQRPRQQPQPRPCHLSGVGHAL